MALPEAFNILAEYLKGYHGAVIASGGKEITKKCHLCGDSKDPTSRHMYIGINRNSNLIVYNCFKCNSGGVVDGQFLRDMGCYDFDVIKSVNDYNSSILSDPRNKWISSTENAVIYRPVMKYRNDQATMNKVSYINNRLGVNLSIQDLANYKIILNLLDYLDANHINNFTRNIDIVQQLDRYFLGFVSSDGSYVNLRRLVEEGQVHENIDRRYIQYNVFGKMDNSNRHYIIPSQVNTLDPSGVDIYITEGPFDALGVRLNLIPNKIQTIVAAVCGSSYVSLAKYFIQKYGIINARFHICPDADVANYKIYRIRDYLIPFEIPIYMHRNIFPGEKDFGVPPNRISEQVIKI